MQQLSIGAVARLTGIPAHTLRKWESRHGIAVPIRSATGRRVYTAEHVETLNLVKMLVERRHALGQLASLSTDELKDLAELHEEPQTAHPHRIALVGENISRLLLASNSVRERFDGNYTTWSPANAERYDAVVVECDTILGEEASELEALHRNDQRVIVVYRHAPRQFLKRLAGSNILSLQSPVDDQQLIDALSIDVRSERPSSPPIRFDTSELARIAALSPGIECECPNHIARLLMDITSFERYSQACIDADPSEQLLHRQLADISAQARRLFEDALIAVTTADGIRINLRSDGPQ